MTDRDSDEGKRKLHEAVAGFGLADTAGADELGKCVTQGLCAHAARAA